MAYDEGLAERLRELLADQPALTEREMFGGIGFMLQGNMSVGVLGDELLVRVGPDEHDAAMDRPHARVFRFHRPAYQGLGHGRRGWVRIGRSAERMGGSRVSLRPLAAGQVAHTAWVSF